VSELATDMLELLVSDGADGHDRQVKQPGPVVQVGRGAGNDIVIEDRRVSAVHGRFLVEEGQVFYQDLGSTNGSALLRGERRTVLTAGSGRGVTLQAGDRLLLGDAEKPTTITFVSLRAGRARAADVTIMARRALGQTRRLPEAETLARLLELLRRLSLGQDNLALARQVLHFFLQVFTQADQAELFLRDSTGSFTPALALGRGGDTVLGSTPSRSLLQRLQEGREAFLIADLQQVEDPSASMRQAPSRSLVLAPLLVDNEVTGAVQVSAGQGSVFNESDLDLVSVVAAQLSTVLSGVRLVERLRQAESRLRRERDYLRQQVGGRPALQEMIGRSAALQRVRQQIQAVAASTTTVLIQGETGVGKELVARAIHEQSPRADAPFVAVNCAALAPGLLESELFGHLKGAFTGAFRERKGLLQVADGGTLFLDEIGELPANLQPKLLRCLEEGLVTQIGATRPQRVDIRLVCATNRDLEREVEAGRFRQDLLFRINTFTIQVAPLRQRPEDILDLANHFMELFAAQEGRRRPGLTADAAAALQAYSWPGNVRELRNEMERACLLVPEGHPLDRAQLSPRLGGGGPAEKLEGSLRETMERLEALVLAEALRRHGGNRTRCARELGISRQALIAKIARLGVDENA